jgi:hypothetical protein
LLLDLFANLCVARPGLNPNSFLRP